MPSPPLNRRRFLTLLSSLASMPALAITPPQPEGPFYPVNKPRQGDTDLTRHGPDDPQAQGQLIRIRGQVQNAAGDPLPGARVEIWQADSFGHYRHPRDTGPGRRDPRFQGWGSAVSDAGGRYSFLTVKPAPYPAGQGWIRPPHIHFRVSLEGTSLLTTQLYFAGEPLNEDDLLLGSLPPARQALLITRLEPAGPHLEGRFDLVVERPGVAARRALTPREPFGAHPG